ncbi:MAG: hypothetical protein IJL83_05725 [Clostridia bacterium]|nr:hypothetical protein [Clostridia bacterium]
MKTTTNKRAKGDRSVKHALYVSIGVMVLSLVMLVGMTFAWFTAQVESDTNFIRTGSVSVAMEWKENWADNWTSFTSSSKLYDVTWIPGEYGVRYIHVKNNNAFPVSLDVTIGAISDVENSAALKSELNIYKKTEGVDAAVTSLVAMGTPTQMDAANAGKIVENKVLAAGEEIVVALAIELKSTATVENAAVQFKVIIGASQQAATTPDATLTSLTSAQIEATGWPVDSADPTNPATNGIDSFVTNPPVHCNELDMAASFSANETAAEVAEKEYKDWRVDFLLSFNKDVAATDIFIAGQMDSFGPYWIGDIIGKDLTAGEKLAIMYDWIAPAFGNQPFVISYEDVVTTVGVFNCGISRLDDTVTDLVATLELVMYDESNNPHVIRTTTYTFD